MLVLPTNLALPSREPGCGEAASHQLNPAPNSYPDSQRNIPHILANRPTNRRERQEPEPTDHSRAHEIVCTNNIRPTGELCIFLYRKNGSPNAQPRSSPCVPGTVSRRCALSSTSSSSSSLSPPLSSYLGKCVELPRHTHRHTQAQAPTTTSNQPHTIRPIESVTMERSDSKGAQPAQPVAPVPCSGLARQRGLGRWKRFLTGRIRRRVSSVP